MSDGTRAKLMVVALSCAALFSAPLAQAAPSVDKKDGTILAFTNTSRTHIEASIVCDKLTLKLKDGRTEKMSMRQLNSKGASDVTAMWNLFSFYIVKDIWRGLIHSDKLMGQANIALTITSDGKHKIDRKAVYVPDCKPIIGDKEKLTGKAQVFWKQVRECVEYIEFAQMKVPDDKVASVTLDIVMGRDLDVFPRYAFCEYQGLLKRAGSTIVRAKTIKR